MYEVFDKIISNQMIFRYGHFMIVYKVEMYKYEQKNSDFYNNISCYGV